MFSCVRLVFFKLFFKETENTSCVMFVAFGFKERTHSTVHQASVGTEVALL